MDPIYYQYFPLEMSLSLNYDILLRIYLCYVHKKKSSKIIDKKY